MQFYAYLLSDGQVNPKHLIRKAVASPEQETLQEVWNVLLYYVDVVL